jgi:hypothetical protein
MSKNLTECVWLIDARTASLFFNKDEIRLSRLTLYPSYSSLPSLVHHKVWIKHQILLNSTFWQVKQSSDLHCQIGRRQTAYIEYIIKCYFWKSRNLHIQDNALLDDGRSKIESPVDFKPETITLIFKHWEIQCEAKKQKNPPKKHKKQKHLPSW